MNTYQVFDTEREYNVSTYMPTDIILSAIKSGTFRPDDILLDGKVIMRRVSTRLLRKYCPRIGPSDRVYFITFDDDKSLLGFRETFLPANNTTVYACYRY
jgi:hypothetical protein